MQTTANYALKKPDGTDVVDIQNFNDNADIIDSELKKRALQADLSSHLADNMAHGIGDKTKLSTTAKDTIVAAINEVFQSGTSVKSSTISAVNSKGGNLSTSATWDQIIAAINSIARGQGNAVESQVISGVDFSNSDGILRHGSMPNNGTVVLTPTTVNQAIVQGYHPGTGYVKGDANLVTANIKCGASIFGVSGKSSVVETTESANPIAASTVRSGKVGYVNGSKITGSLAVQATTAQTITPGTSDIVKGAGIYDAAITVKGDSNLQPNNIKENIPLFGITGTVQEKQDFSDYLFNIPQDGSSYCTLGFIENEGLYVAPRDTNKTIYLLNSSGTIIKTITNASTYGTRPLYIDKNYIIWGGVYSNSYYTITDKNGTVILERDAKNIDSNISYVDGACINNGLIYLIVDATGNNRALILDFNGTVKYQSSYIVSEISTVFFTIPISNGILVGGLSFGNNLTDYFIVYISSTGTVKYIYHGARQAAMCQIFSNVFKNNN